MSKKRFPTVKIIKIGTIQLEASDMASNLTLQIKTDLRIGGGSTVTLIEAEKKILVDTGFDYEFLDGKKNKKENARILTKALDDNGVKPDDIDMVFITHWHKDHFGNSDIFNKARIMVARPLAERLNKTDLIGLKDNDEIASGVKIQFTPGHTIDHASLIVETKFAGIKTRVGIAGDCIISHSYFHSGKIWKYNSDFYDEKAAGESALRLINASDIVIPGHGVPFLSFVPAK